jgi:general secretion pathway protein C
MACSGLWRRRGRATVLAVGLLLPLGVAAADLPAGHAAPPAAFAERPATTSTMRLTGVVTSPRLGVLRAIIAGPGAGERSYRVGDRLPDGSTLAAIDADRVLLRRDESDRVVSLEPSEGVPPDVKPARIVTPSHASRQTASVAHDATPRAAAAAMRANPVLLLQLVPFEAIVNQHRMVALRVGKPDDPSLIKELKLRPGDVITAVNGVEFNGPDAGAWMQPPPAPAHELTLKVYRDGETETLRY